jgi:hypothetical protein
MVKYGRQSNYPSNILNISINLGTIIIIILLITVIFMLYAIFFIKPQSPTIIMPKQTPPQTTVIPIKGGDSRYDIAPQPLRNLNTSFDLTNLQSSIPFGFPTQGLSESFSSVGVVKVEDKILPLYGRRTAGGGGDRWNYYTRTDTYNPVPIPVKFQKRDCMDDVGCNEILSGEEIKVDVMNKSGRTSIYKFDGPKYIPGLI